MLMLASVCKQQALPDDAAGEHPVVFNVGVALLVQIACEFVVFVVRGQGRFADEQGKQLVEL